MALSVLGCGDEGDRNDPGAVLAAMAAEHRAILEGPQADSLNAEGHRARVARVAPVLERYEAARSRARDERQADRLDSLAGALYDRLGYSYHALRDTARWAEASDRRLDLLYYVGQDSTRSDEHIRMAYGVGQRDYARGMRVLWGIAERALDGPEPDSVTFAHAWECIRALRALHPGGVVSVAEADPPVGDASACVPTDAALWAFGVAVTLLLLWGAWSPARGRVPPYLYAR